MLRQIFVFIHLFPFIFLINTTDFKKEELKVELQAPTSIEKGQTVDVELKITGGSVKGFAKYVDALPAGFEAEALEIGDATFTANNGQVKILWVNFPELDEVVIKYRLKATQEAVSAQIGGKFSYLDNNEKKVYSVFKKDIQVASQEQLAAQEKLNEPVPISVEVSRKIIQSKGDVHQIQITVKQQGIDGFAKVQEFVPFGTQVEKGETENASYSMVKNKVKFVWMSVPKKESFTITYFVDLSEADSKDVNSITGDFSYLENDISKKIEINFSEAPALLANQTKQEESATQQVEEKSESENTVEIKSDNESPQTEAGTAVVAATIPESKPEQKEEVTEAKEQSSSTDANLKTEVAEETIAVNSSSENEVAQEVVEEEVAVNSPAVKEENESSPDEQEELVTAPIEQQIEVEQSEPVSTSTNESTTPTNSSGSNNGLPTGSVVYRVQIAAGKNVVDAAYFKARHKFEQDFNIENHQGWVKYTTGKFGVYQQARNSRERINSGGYSFDGPFVTAYNAGTRITVQEALMISNQKWFK